MQNPQHTPSEEDRRITEENPNVDESADDMDTGTDAATGMPIEGDMGYAGGAVGTDTENAYAAPEDLRASPRTPSQTGVVGSGRDWRTPGETDLEDPDAATETGVVGAGETEDGGTVPPPER